MLNSCSIDHEVAERNSSRYQPICLYSCDTQSVVDMPNNTINDIS